MRFAPPPHTRTLLPHGTKEASLTMYTEKNWMFPEPVVAQSVVKKEVQQNISKGQLSTTNNSSRPAAAK